MEFRPIFEFFIDYEKSKGDRDKQLKAVDRLLDYDRTFATEQKDLSIQIKKDYDNQRLLDEKAQLENDIQKERRIFAVVLGLLAISLVIGLFYFFKRKKEKKQLAENTKQKTDEIPVEKEEIAHDLINLDSENSTEEIAEENQVEELTEVETPKEVAEELQEKKDEAENVIVRPTTEESQEPKEPDYSEYLPIGKETAIQILKKLDQFEKRKKYLKGNLRLSKLATEMNTNDKYLARVIKVKTGKIFNFYINDLRFDYLQKLIDEDPNFFKKKKIKDLSKHLGFSSPEFFTNLFKERYGISPKEYFNDTFFENRTPRSEEQNG